MNGRPVRRCSKTACPRRLGARLGGMREENTVVLGPLAFVLGPSLVLGPSSVPGPSVLGPSRSLSRPRSLWTMDCGPWTVDHGLWTKDCGPGTVDHGLWTKDGPRTDQVPSTKDQGLCRLAQSRRPRESDRRPRC